MDMLLTTGEQISIALLSMAIHQLGYEAISFTGWQAGMMTDSVHGNARITDIQPQRLLDALAQGKIVIVAGFQGISPEGEITTLGRGGSDTTAVALAAALKADVCEIYTDVDGVYSTDPRVVRNARKLTEISYDEMLELAHLGAAVLHPRAVEYAKNYAVCLVVRSSFNYREGTYVKEEARMEQGIIVRGIAYDKDVSRISILGVADVPGQLAKVFTALANEGINVDIIVQSGISNGGADFSFTVAGKDRQHALQIIERIRPIVQYRDVTYEDNLVKVSMVGAGMVSHPGVAAKMFEVISRHDVNIKMVSTSEIKVSCVIDGERVFDIVRSLHTEFGLDTNDEAFVGGPQVRR
jgi:aspartate kinase